MEYKKLAFWETKRRIKLLSVFRELLIGYFNDLRANNHSNQYPPLEGEVASRNRIEINKLKSDVQQSLLDANCYPFGVYREAPIAGGRVMNFDPLGNLFELYRFEVDPRITLDAIESGFGVYEKDLLPSLLRTLNPFWWIFRVVSWFASLPFVLLGNAGFDRTRAEKSMLGKLTKLIVELAVFLVALFQLDEMMFDGKYLQVLRSLLSM